MLFEKVDQSIISFLYFLFHQQGTDIMATTHKKTSQKITSKRILKARQNQTTLTTFLHKKLDSKLAQKIAKKINMITSLYEKDLEAFSTALESTGILIHSYGQQMETTTREMLSIGTRIS